MSVKRITASYIYTLDAGEPIRNGFVEYDDTDGTILNVGECASDEVVQDCAIVPGFVNSHCHVEL